MDSIDEALARLKKFSAIAKEFSPELQIRLLDLFQPLLLGDGTTDHNPSKAPPGEKKTTGVAKSAGKPSSLNWEDFYQAHQAKLGQPAEAAFFCAAWWFSQYGSAPFTADDIRDIANQAGLTIPSRLDMTFKGAKSSGKDCFQAAGRGKLKPTTAGELRLKEEWGVGKGSSLPPQGGGE